MSAGFLFARRRQTAAAIIAIILLGLGTWGCGVKKTVRVLVPPKKVEAKTATLDQLLVLLQNYRDRIRTLSSTSMKVSFTSGHAESGQVEEYRSAPAYILLERPDDIRVNIQNPLTKTTILELLSVGDRFSVWYPRENKYYIGSNSARELSVPGDSKEMTFTARPSHIFEAILPQAISLDDAGRRIAVTEEEDASAKYYVLSVFEETGSTRLRTIRRLWIERSAMRVTKMQTYVEGGRVAGTVHYSNFKDFDGLEMPVSIRIERPLDGYSLDLEFKEWRLNPALPETAFAMVPPPGAQQVILREKGRNLDR